MKSQSGLTISETLIAVTVLAIVLTVATTLFHTINTTYIKSRLQGEINAEIQGVMETFGSRIRAADRVVSAGNDMLILQTDIDTYECFEREDTYLYHKIGTSQSCSGGTVEAMLTPDVRITDLSFSLVDDAEQLSTVVTFRVRLEKGKTGGTGNLSAAAQLSSSVVLRNYGT
jgi:Tfp pilus assembly protein PilE